MRTECSWIVRLMALVGLAASAAVVGFVLLGISARPEPPALETRLARAARHLLIPAVAKKLENPLPVSQELMKSARLHFADHCASCHGNDGRGQTALGRSLYPRAPDMTTTATQALSDGELFWIIENGIRLTGMPAWGTLSPEDDAASWELVLFIRRLPSLTASELAEMKRANPAPRSQIEEELSIDQFLAGGAPKERPKP